MMKPHMATAEVDRDRLGRWLSRGEARHATRPMPHADVLVPASVPLPRKPGRRIEVEAVGDRIYITTPGRHGTIGAHSVGFTRDEAQRVAERVLELVHAPEPRHV